MLRRPPTGAPGPPAMRRREQGLIERTRVVRRVTSIARGGCSGYSESLRRPAVREVCEAMQCHACGCAGRPHYIGQAEPSRAEPSRAKPSRVESSQADGRVGPESQRRARRTSRYSSPSRESSLRKTHVRTGALEIEDCKLEIGIRLIGTKRMRIKMI